MKRNYSTISFTLVCIGIFITIMPFPPLNIEYFGLWGIVFTGFMIYIIGVILGIIALLKKEKSFLKYISVSSILFGILFVMFFFAIIGQM
ncbi:hypothetical protein [Sporosarcina sp. FSL K6-2383]|uniref:hypothetical protein n=1 Tax=Sporosarcina sp. FSL K6-2383 TaxID=2921556 RepID=UPI003159B04D